MNRALVTLSFLAAIAAATVACSSSTDQLINEPEPADAEDETETTPATKKTEQTTPPASLPPPAQAPDASTPPPPPPANDGTCESTANKTDCAKCCAIQKNPITQCACNAGANCAQSCSGSLCDGKPPSFGCGLCMIQEKCELGDGTEVQQCLLQCASKPNQ